MKSDPASAKQPRSEAVSSPLSRIVPLLAAVKLAAHLATNAHYPLHRDELYYLMCGRHPAWGYPDHPPLTPWLASVSEHLFGLSAWGLRLWPALAGAGVVMLAGWLASRFGGGRLAQMLAALAVLLAPVYLVSGSLMQTVGLDQFFWMAAAAALVAVLNGGSRRLLLVTGAMLGLGLWAKFTILVWCFGLLLGLLLTRDRRLLRGGWLWLGAAVAAACAAPAVLWQAQHDWPLLEFMAAGRADDPVRPWTFVLEQIGMSGPLVGTALLAFGFAFLLRGDPGRRWRSLGLACAAAWGLFLITGGKPYYAAPTYPLLMAAGAVLAERKLAVGESRVRRRTAVLLLATQVWMLPAFLPVIPVRFLAPIIHKLPQDDWANMFGWQEVAGQLAEICDAIPAGDEPGLRILAPNYGVAGAVDLYGPGLGLPAAISGHNGYAFWEAAPAMDPLLVIGYDADWLRRIYADVQDLGVIEGTKLGPDDEAGCNIHLCRGLKLPPADLWADIRHFD